MGKFRIEINEIAEKHIKQHYKSENKKSIKTIEKIILELSENPYSDIGYPEPLKQNLSGYWSRRINQKDRMIYSVEDEKLLPFMLFLQWVIILISKP
jgi:toxin YoeB